VEKNYFNLGQGERIHHLKRRIIIKKKEVTKRKSFTESQRKEAIRNCLQNTNPDLKRDLDFEFTYGKYKDKTIQEVIKKDIFYIDLLRAEGFLKLTPIALVYLIRRRNDFKARGVAEGMIDFYTHRGFEQLMDDLKIDEY